MRVISSPALANRSPGFRAMAPVILRATHGLGNPYVVSDKDEGVVGEVSDHMRQALE